MKNIDYKKIIVEFCRILLGAVFVFSGFVKAVDPLGSAYKNIEYLSAFGLDFFQILALPLAFAQIAVEFAMGACLLAGVYRRFHSILFLAFMCVMTPLTLYLALKNPVSDCGCFGDALIITNWQTFYKNIVLLAAAVVIFLDYKKITPLFKTSSLAFWFTAFSYLFIIGISLYCYLYLPILDFRPYKIGANIPQLMEIPEDAPVNEYEISLIYAQDGVEQVFSRENYPKGDSTWTFVDTQRTLIKKGYEPPIHDFSITTEDGDDITGDVLGNQSYTFLLIAHKLEKANDLQIDKINALYDFCKANNYDFYCLTASLPADIEEWRAGTGAEYPFCTTDDTTLKTIIRSNPGWLLLKDGVIINKWSNLGIPAAAKWTAPLESSVYGQIPANHAKRNIVFIGLVFICVSLLFLWCDRKSSNKDQTK
ncbi:MAG: DoxX family protein [Dysgonamonadaceae bacterium]|jgi:uncharacterized membrane protein YphA (DoxX/SURF4 family)|nr:DoxX family protein [Dysgonamonadaceae bacterium]